MIKSFPFAYIRFTLHFSVDNVKTSENKTKKQRKRMGENKKKKSKEKFCEMKNRYRERKCKLSFEMWKRKKKEKRKNIRTDSQPMPLISGKCGPLSNKRTNVLITNKVIYFECSSARRNTVILSWNGAQAITRLGIAITLKSRKFSGFYRFASHSGNGT